MDEIFNRIKSIKIKRKTLVVSLILTELLGISVLVWFLKIPLTLKYLTIPPKKYSLEYLETDKQYLFNQGDFITGRTLPGSKVFILLTPNGFKQTIIADNEGNFTFQLPPDTPPQKYQLDIINDNVKLVPIKSFTVRLETSNKLKSWTGVLIK